MQKVFHFDSPREKYRCDAAVIWCFDNRFHIVLNKFLKKLGIEHSDPIEIAGGAKCLATPDLESEREFVLEQIRKSMNLHSTRRVILMVHSDCGAYGGLEKFSGDRDAERVHHREELLRASRSLAAAISGIAIDTYFVDFEGVWEPDLAALAAAAG